MRTLNCTSSLCVLINSCRRAICLRSVLIAPTDENDSVMVVAIKEIQSGNLRMRECFTFSLQQQMALNMLFGSIGFEHPIFESIVPIISTAASNSIIERYSWVISQLGRQVDMGFILLELLPRQIESTFG